MSQNKELINAVLMGDLLTVKSLVNNININIPDKYGRTIIYDAITKGFTSIVNELCLLDININHQDNNGKSALHMASIHNKLDCAKILIQNGADVNIKDHNGNTPIFDAIFNSGGEIEIILLLKNNGANYTMKNNHGVSPKELASLIANFDVTHIFD